jgi:RNA polymerase primary sigma factor
MQAIGEHSRMIRIPLNKVGDLSKISKASSALEQVYERTATTEELADKLEMSVEKVNAALGSGVKHISYDAPFSSVEENTLLDVLHNNHPSTDDAMLAESLHVELLRSLQTLNEKEREILVMAFGIRSDQALSLEEIGEKYSLSKERVRQIRDNALQRLRKNARSIQALQVYLS